jgi:predicted glutamine amidotransferase
MCRLFALISGSDVDIRYWMLDAVRPFVGWSSEHRHGWGIGWYENGTARLEKEPVPALDSQKFIETAKDAKSRVFVCHLRKATCGGLEYCNSQPFKSGNWVFAHNGTVDGQYLMSKLTHARLRIKGETDSEVYFHWLLQNLEKEGVEGLRFGIDEVRKRRFTALNFVMSDGYSLYAYCEQSPSAKAPYPDYYQLYYSESTERRRAAAVCSERIDEGEWAKIPFGSLLTVSQELKTRVIAFT